MNDFKTELVSDISFIQGDTKVKAMEDLVFNIEVEEPIAVKKPFTNLKPIWLGMGLIVPFVLLFLLMKSIK